MKSAILLAGLRAEGVTAVTEPHISRDHTERMLEAFGVKVTREGKTVKLAGGQKLTATDVQVPVTYHQLPFLSSRCNYSK